MAIGLGSNFELRAKLPLDSRSLFDTVADLKAYPENFLADSCDALVKDEPNTLFIFNRNNADDAELGKWRRLKGSDLTDYLKKVDADTLYVSKEDGKSLLSDTDKTKYDDAATKAHKHTNGAVLDDLSDSNGILMYKGSIIGSNSGSDTTTGYTKTETDALLGTKVDKVEGKDLLADIDKTKYDDAVTKAHKHTNSAVLDKLTDNSGELEYNGKKISADLSTVYTKTEADTLLDDKVNKEDGKSLLSDTDKELYDDAVSKAHEHTNSTVLDKLSEDVDGNPTYNGKKISADLSTVYTKTETDTLLADKLDKVDGKDLLDNTDKDKYDDAVTKAHEHTNSTVLDDLSDSNGILLYKGSIIGSGSGTTTGYTKTEADALLATKVDKVDGKSLLADTDKADYDDAVTKAHKHTNSSVLDKLSEDAEGNPLYNGKKISADLSTVYSKTEADALLDTKVDKEEGYSLLADTDKTVYDDAVSKAHEHSNKEVINKFTEDSEGNPLYDGKSIGGSGASSADQVSYENSSYPAYENVDAALGALFDEVFYVKPQITSFEITPNTTVYEIGNTVNSIKFDWVTNKNITSQSLTDCTLTDESVRTATYDTPLSTDKTFTLTVSDGKETATATKQIKFNYKVYYGSAANTDTYDDAFLLGLSNGVLKSNKSGSYTVDVANNEYFYIAMPQSYNDSDELSGKIGGFETSFDKVASFEHTNASGASTTYNVYRSTNHSLSSITFAI